MTEYYVFEIENTKYKLMLDKLCNLSDRFCLVEPIADTKDFPDILPEPKGELEKFLIERKRTCVWPGTKIKLRSKNKEAIQHFYKCSKASIDILKRYSDFFQYIKYSFLLQRRQCPSDLHTERNLNTFSIYLY